MSRLVPLVAVTGLVGLTTLATAPSSSGQIASEVSLKVGSHAQVVRGRVSSGSPACERGRRVVVKKLRSGSDLPIAQTRTDSAGRYRVAAALGFATYYAQVRGENRGRTSPVLCSGDRSPSITFALADPAPH